MRLLYLDHDGFSGLVKRFEKEVDNIKSDSLKMAWYMRGGITYEQIMNLSVKERDMIGKIIEDNLETTKNTKMPFF